MPGVCMLDFLNSYMGHASKKDGYYDEKHWKLEFNSISEITQ